MNPQWAAPPAADPCLFQLYSSRSNQKGGTFIDGTVVDLASHRRKLLTPDEYRPEACRCGCDCLHVHGLRERHPRQCVVDGLPVPVIDILVFICSACGGTWRVLPGFLARCLWRPWNVVERETLAMPRAPGAPPVPVRTVQRWRARLAQAARLPIQVLVVAGGKLRALAERAGLEATRAQFVQACGLSFAGVAVLLHRLAPGVRLM